MTYLITDITSKDRFVYDERDLASRSELASFVKADENAEARDEVDYLTTFLDEGAFYGSFDVDTLGIVVESI